MKAIKTLGKYVYGLVGITGVASAIWAFLQWGRFWSTMGLWGGLGFTILTIGGINWGVKVLVGKDIFGN